MVAALFVHQAKVVVAAHFLIDRAEAFLGLGKLLFVEEVQCSRGLIERL